MPRNHPIPRGMKIKGHKKNRPPHESRMDVVKVDVVKRMQAAAKRNRR